MREVLNYPQYGGPLNPDENSPEYHFWYFSKYTPFQGIKGHAAVKEGGVIKFVYLVDIKVFRNHPKFRYGTWEAWDSTVATYPILYEDYRKWLPKK